MNNLARMSNKIMTPKSRRNSIVFLAILFVLLGHAFVFSMSPLLGIGLLLMVFCVLVFCFKPFWITLAFVSASAGGPFLNIPLTQDGIMLSTILLVIGFLVLVIGGVLRKDSDLVLVPFAGFRPVLVLSLLMVTIISLVNSLDVAHSILEIKNFIYCVLCYLVVILTVKDGSRFRQTLVCMVSVGFVVSLFGLLEAVWESVYTHFNYRSLFGSPVWVDKMEIEDNRLDGLIGSSNGHGIYMAIICLFSFYLFLRSPSKTVRCVLAMGMLVSLFNIVGTATRGAMLALFVSFVVVWIFNKTSRKWLALIFGSLILVVPCAAVLAPDLDVNRIYSYGGKETDTVHVRWQHLYAGLMMVQDHPLIGKGPYGYLTNYHRYAFQTPADVKKSTRKLHNAFVEVLVNYGIIGFTIFVSFVLSTIISLFLLVRNPRLKDRSLEVTILGAACGYSVFMMSTGWLVNQTYWLIMALGSAACSINRRRVVEKEVAGRKSVV